MRIRPTHRTPRVCASAANRRKPPRLCVPFLSPLLHLPVPSERGRGRVEGPVCLTAHMENQERDPPQLCRETRRIAVLLVDDQRFVGLAVGRLLAGEQDIDLHCCLTAVDAVQRANEIGPTIILQDLVLPDIDGVTMVRLFRSNPSTAETPIVVLSGDDSPETRARARAAGANDYLVKLPGRADLVACIRRHAIGAEAVDPVPEPDRPAESATAGDEAEETLDRRVMAEFRQAGTGGAPDFALLLIDGFIAEASSQVQTLREARLRLDGRTVQAIAHSLKGSSMTMGARKLAALCTKVEGHADSMITIDLMTAIDREFDKVRDALAIERQDLNPL